MIDFFTTILDYILHDIYSIYLVIILIASGALSFFYDTDPAEAPGTEILDIRQCAETYTITKIQRRSSTKLAFMLDGIVDVEALGFNGKGTPLIFGDDLTGSDISTLPTSSNGTGVSFNG